MCLKTKLLYIQIIVILFVWVNANCTKISDDSPREVTEAVHFTRLSENIFPNQYELWLKIDLSLLAFSGNVIIYITIISPTNIIQLNVKDLNIVTDSFLLINNAQTEVHAVSITEKMNEVIEFQFMDELQSGEYQLHLNFSSSITSNLKGLYYSTYRDSSGFNTRLAVTQMEGTYARMVFPCFDEPHFKAFFQINIIHDIRYIAISNMPEFDKTIINPAEVLTRFQNTNVKMSTYLVGFLVSNYEHLSSNDDFIRVFAPPHFRHRLHFALDYTNRSLTYLETFLNRKYQLPKLDLASISDFSFGAMENWGIITFREPLLYYDYDNPRLSFARTHQSGALLIMHELAHMWFGNEVTPEWWKYIWLSEGFARYFEYYGTSMLIPEWRIMDQYIVNNVQSSMASDDKIMARAMTSEVSEPDVINNMFDYIVYAKSSSVIRMFQCVIGMDAFQQILQNYISQRSHLTTNPDFLFNQFDTTINELNIQTPNAFKLLMETWSNQPGYPVVFADRNYDTNEIVLKQQRFLMNGEDLLTRYAIPINIATSINPNFDDISTNYWLVNDSIKFAVPLESNQNWIILNKQVTGYYRVNYDNHNWQLLIHELNSDNFMNINVLNRAQLIDDAVNLGKTNLLTFSITFDILNYLQHEIDFIPWISASNALTYFDRILRGPKSYNNFNIFVQNITGIVYSTVRLITDEIDHILRIHRLNTAKWACQSGLDDCIKDANTMFNAMIDNNDVLEEIKEIIFCTISRYGSDEAIALLDIYYLNVSMETREDDLLTRVINGIGCSRNTTILNKYLDMAIAQNQFNQGFPIFRSIIQGSYEGTDAVLNYLFQFYNTVRQRIGIDAMPQMFNMIGPWIINDELLTKLNRTIEKYKTIIEPDPNALKAANSALQTGRENIIWVEKHQPTIDKWIEHKINNNSASVFFVNIWLLLLVCFSLAYL